MKKLLPAAVALLALTLPAAAQNWSIGAGSGPFIFGDFTERTIRVGTPEGPGDPVTLTLSAATRAGLLVDIQREFADRWAVRLEGSFTRSKLSVRDESNDDGINLDAGDLDVTTIALPLVFRINPHGALRFHLRGGPAMAMYRIEGTDGTSETRDEWGLTVGGGAAWWLSEQLALEGNFSDTVTTSPFEPFEDNPDNRVETKRPHNIHTTVGVRWRF